METETRSSHAVAPDAESFKPEQLIIALFSVAGARAACHRHGDGPMVAALQRYYALLARELARANGQVLKVIGDGAIAEFPAERAEAAVNAMRRARDTAAELWQRFDPECRVQVRATLGVVLRGPLGPPDNARQDLYGDALNTLFKTPPSDFVLLPALEAALT